MSLAMVLFVVIYGCIKIAHNEIEAKQGYKYKFVNVHSKGMWDEDATHWTYFPKPPCL
jgi:hypothetical protein